jgi:hypothetical protein
MSIKNPKEGFLGIFLIGIAFSIFTILPIIAFSGRLDTVLYIILAWLLISMFIGVQISKTPDTKIVRISNYLRKALFVIGIIAAIGIFVFKIFAFFQGEHVDISGFNPKHLEIWVLGSFFVLALLIRKMRRMGLSIPVAIGGSVGAFIVGIIVGTLLFIVVTYIADLFNFSVGVMIILLFIFSVIAFLMGLSYSLDGDLLKSSSKK